MPLLGLCGLWLLAWLCVATATLLAEQRLGRRFGVPVSIGDLSLGWVSHEVEDIRFGGPGLAMDLHIADVQVRAPVAELLRSGRRGLGAVRVRGVSGSVDVSRLAPPIIPDRPSATPSSSPGKAGPRWIPTLVVKDVQVVVRDRSGPWLSFALAHAGVSPKGAQLEDGRLTLLEHAAQLAIADVSLGASVADGHPRLEAGRIGQVTLRLLRDGGAPLSLARTRAAVLELRSAFLPKRVVDAPLSEPPQTPTPPVVAGPPSAVAAMLHGAPSVVAGLSIGGERNVPGVAVAGDSVQGKVPAKVALPFLRLLGEDALVEVESARVELAENGRIEPLLSQAEIRVAMEGDGRVASQGSGTAIGGGHIAWDFQLGADPFELSGDLDVETLPLRLLASAVPQVPWHEPDRGHINARLRLRTTGVGLVSWDGEFSLTDAAVFSARIAPEPVTGVRVALQGKGALRPLSRRIEVTDGQLSIGDAHLNVSGAAALNASEYHLSLDARLPETSCEAAVKAIPAALLGELQSLHLGGTLAGSVHFYLDSEALEQTELKVDVKDRCHFAVVPEAMRLRRFRAPFLHEVEEPDGSTFSFVTGPGTDEYTYLEDISPYLVHAVLAHEDTRFFTHGGFSPFHIRNAIVRNLQEGRYVVGASTISMQLVKNILLHREKTMSRKLQEVLLTWYLERELPKRDILELYLNVIEYGPSIYGIRHAASHYFKRLPAELSPAEATFFATILPSPKKRHAYYERGALSPSWQGKMRSLLVRLGARGSYDEEAVAYGLAEVDDFRFVKDGQGVEPRILLGTTEPLPYQQGYWVGDDLDLTNTNTNTNSNPFLHPGFGLPLEGLSGE